MPLQIDFIRDVAGRCLERLTEAGYAYMPADDEDSIYTYLQIRHRRVRAQPRTVHRAAYTAPPHLAAGEQQFLAKVEAGVDLWPHQSRKIGQASVEDGMLNDYGIQHFHLGTLPDPRHGQLVSGTKELLFAIVKDGDFYAIGIHDHHAWTKQSLLDVVHETWPHLTEPYSIKGASGLRRHPTDEARAQLRAGFINVLQQRADGTIQLGMGGGIASDGSSIAVRRETDNWILHTEQLQRAVAHLLEKEVVAGRLPADAPVRIIWYDDRTLAVSDPPTACADITGQLVIPRL